MNSIWTKQLQMVLPWYMKLSKLYPYLLYILSIPITYQCAKHLRKYKLDFMCELKHAVRVSRIFERANERIFGWSTKRYNYIAHQTNITGFEATYYVNKAIKSWVYYFLK